MSQVDILLESGTNELEILELFLDEMFPGKEASERSFFGINVAKVMQVIESPDLKKDRTGSHPSFLGTISLRNRIIPILDLSTLLKMKVAPCEHEVVIITEFSGATTGILVNGVTDIHRVSWSEVAPSSAYLDRVGQGTIIGMVNLGDHFIQLLDLESLLAELDPESMTRPVDNLPRPERSYKALVADDSASIRFMLTRNLEEAGFTLDVVSNGQEALDRMLRISKEISNGNGTLRDHIDILISDIEMPLMDGFSLTKRVKEDPNLGSLPVILYSSLITRELRHKGESVGADDQISKPELSQMAGRAVALIEKFEKGTDSEPVDMSEASS